MKRKDGKDRFILFESESDFESWQKVNLSTVLLVTYEDECGHEVYRIRKAASASEWRILSVLRRFFKSLENTKFYSRKN